LLTVLVGTLLVGVLTRSPAAAWSGVRSPHAANAYAATTVHTIPAITMTGNLSDRLV
jgi:hypothetical protein